MRLTCSILEQDQMSSSELHSASRRALRRMAEPARSFVHLGRCCCEALARMPRIRGCAEKTN